MRFFIKSCILTIFVAGLLSGTSASSLAQGRSGGLIRDVEIENTIRVYTAPIFAAADLDINAVRIHLVNDKRLNAFVSGGQQIFINTGLLMQADYPEEVIGVIAHETGHITGGHLARFQEGAEAAQAQAIATMLLGVPLAILSGRGDVAAASVSLGSHIGQRSMLQYTRSMEQGADQAALNFLDEAKISSGGLLRFLSRVGEMEKLYSASTNEYTRSHPLTKNRLDHIENHLLISKYTDDRLPREYVMLHERMRAKLRGYMLPANEVANLYPQSDQSVPAKYARAINLMRQHKTADSLKITNGLIENSPKDPFFYELKGDILRDAGELEKSIAPYEKSLEILPWAALIRVSLAHVQIELDKPDYYSQAIINLRDALRYEPSNLRAWKLLATAYGRTEDYGNAALAQAEYADRRGDKAAALKNATKAQNLLPVGSAGRLRAEDIEFRAKEKTAPEN